MNVLLRIFVGLLPIFQFCHRSDYRDYPPMDYRQFNNTEYEDLAKAIRDSDTSEIRHQIVDLGIDVNGRSKPYGITPLMIAVSRIDYVSTECLLKLGANPNIYSNPDLTQGDNAVLQGARRGRPELLKMLLQYGGDPDSRGKGWKQGNGGIYERNNDFALGEVAAWSLPKVKLLVDAGADVNQTGGIFNDNALGDALNIKRMDIVYYLLTHSDIDYNRTFTLLIQDSNGELKYVEVDIMTALRYAVLDLDNKMYRYKQSVIQYLKKRGLDYYKTPIPEDVIVHIKSDYPDNWQEYIAKY